jgi:hypothetical protein
MLITKEFPFAKISIAAFFIIFSSYNAFNYTTCSAIHLCRIEKYYEKFILLARRYYVIFSFQCLTDLASHFDQIELNTIYQWFHHIAGLKMQFSPTK